MPIKRCLFFPCLLFLGALGLRLFYIYEHSHSPFFNAPIVDARVFYEAAKTIAQGDLWYGNEPFWQPPFYIYYLALIYKLFPTDFFVITRLLQASADALSCLLIFLIAQRSIHHNAARIAGLMAACYGVSIYFLGELLAVSLEVVLYLALILTLQFALKKEHYLYWLTAGLLAGISAITRPTILVFIGLLLLWLLLHKKRQSGTWSFPFKAWVGLLVPITCIVLPISARNYIIGGEWIWISANGGINFYLGNNSEYDANVGIRPGIPWERLVQEPLDAGYNTASERSTYFTHKAIHYIHSNPLDYISLWIKKTYLFWSGTEIKRNQDIYYARTHSSLLSILLWERIISFPFGLIAPFCLLGLLLSWKDRSPALSLLRLYLFSSMFSVLLFFVTSRYRLPVVPAMLIFAAIPLIHFKELFQTCQYRRLTLLSGILIVLIFVLNQNKSPRIEKDAQLCFDLGEVHLRQENYSDAILWSRQALYLDPNYNYARHNLAVAYFYTKRYQDTVQEALRVITENPRRADTHALLGRAYHGQNQPRQAFSHFKQALKIAPADGIANYYYGRLLLKQGHPRTAIEHLEKAHLLFAQDFWLCYELGQAYQQTENTIKALEYFQLAFDIEPRPQALNAIGVVYLLEDNYTTAQDYFNRVLTTTPNNLEALVNSGIIKMEQGHLPEAIDALKNVQKRYPQEPLAYRGLIEAYRRAGQSKIAAKLQNRLNTLRP